MLTIKAEAIEQFLEVIKTTNPSWVIKNPERTLRKFWMGAEQIEISEWVGLLAEKPGVSYYLYNSQGYIFEVHSNGINNFELTKVLRAKPLKKKRQLIKKYSPSDLKFLESQRKAVAKTIKRARPPIDLARVVFTNHALERFAEQFPGSTNGNHERCALKILTHASEVGAIRDDWKVVRIINHDFEEVRYFRNGGCRFVVDERDGKFIVITIEKAFLK